MSSPEPADKQPRRPDVAAAQRGEDLQRRLEQSTAELDARLQRAEHSIADLHAAVSADVPGAAPPGTPGPATPAAGKSAAPAAQPRRYTSLEDWVQQRFVAVFCRKVGTGSGDRWCRRWWRHAEAISRLESLWRSWETLRLDPDMGIGVWYRDFLDPQLTVLLGPGGPFARCTVDRHEEDRPLPADSAPDGYWSAASPNVAAAAGPTAG